MVTTPADEPTSGGQSDRRRAVLESALETFSRFGYRKTSMDDVARASNISRPGLYFLFDSKPVLFREAVTHALDRDLGLIAVELGRADRPLSERLIAAFDLWAGSYIGPLTGDLPGAVGADKSLLGPVLDEAPRRFEGLVADAVTRAGIAESAARTQTLISASIGIKHRVATRADYLDRLMVAVELLLG